MQNNDSLKKEIKKQLQENSKIQIKLVNTVKIQDKNTYKLKQNSR